MNDDISDDNGLSYNSEGDNYLNKLVDDAVARMKAEQTHYIPQGEGLTQYITGKDGNPIDVPSFWQTAQQQIQMINAQTIATPSLPFMKPPSQVPPSIITVKYKIGAWITDPAAKQILIDLIKTDYEFEARLACNGTCIEIDIPWHRSQEPEYIINLGGVIGNYEIKVENPYQIKNGETPIPEEEFILDPVSNSWIRNPKKENNEDLAH